jgi:CRP-like cAMP-binding protein
MRELRLIASLVTEIQLHAGRVLVRQGTIGHECFLIVEGHAVVERDNTFVGHLGAGALFGEQALMNAAVRDSTVTAATDIHVLVMSRTEFASLRALGIRCIDERLEAAAAQHRDVVAPLVEALADPPVRSVQTA